MSETPFSLVVGEETLIGDLLGDSATVQVLLLHGAGSGNRLRQRRLRELLLQQGVSSAAFDFSGHGESSANAPGSLEKRLLQASAVLHHINHQQQLHTVVGTSMSGEIAIRLAYAHPGQIQHLVLMVGAIYAGDAFSLPFGPDFSAAIRRPQSWRSAETLEMIAHFRGALTLIRALEDSVIPFEIADLLAQAAGRASSVRVMDLPGVDHRISERIANDDALRAHIADVIMQREVRAD
ncbi:hypothetical protein FHW67_001341 [Herbaspirillum sp. Sphag1AN]|uniref:alpha/beta fold hydrolase n=1 Tax=unclassified Herbaspirillum TaxID=2624150 RepID=UPI00160E3E44|nr:MULTISPECIES: alpha/beta hydrolase [unclassified Herbaspirillum]MBB3212073.1 hypothetical protein [Herbaspirillum sp. Sphag1AN]MBB3244093.1 hypothetical protein [Herbaspirillum sp. Sphag64]